MAKVRSFFKTNKLSVAEKQKMIKFCKTFRYETYKRMKCFIKQGRKSSGKMYIIINGKVGVYTKKINKLSQCRRGQPMPFSQSPFIKSQFMHRSRKVKTPIQNTLNKFRPLEAEVMSPIELLRAVSKTKTVVIQAGRRNTIFTARSVTQSKSKQSSAEKEDPLTERK